MSGRLVEAWDYTWGELWQPLLEVEDAPADLLMEVYAPLVDALRPFPDPRQVSEELREAYLKEYEAAKNAWVQAQTDASNDATIAAEQLQLLMTTDFKGDHALARAFEDIFEVLDELGIPGIAREFYDLTTKFLRCHNIRYRLIKPYVLRPHISGWFSGLVSQVETMIASNAHLQRLLRDFEHSLNQVSRSKTQTDVTHCIEDAVELMEGIASRYPGATGTTFGALCDSAGEWPHKAVQKAYGNLYGFCSDYPGIRHGLGEHGVLRDLKNTDAVVCALMFLASAGYFVPGLDLAEIVG